MVSRTRTRRNSDGDEDAETVVEMEESEKTGEVKSDMSYDSKFIIAQGSSLAGKNLYFLRHPKSLSAALYVISNDSVEEVLRIDQPCRSFLYGESVISNGSFTVFSPIHPLFLVVPYILKNARSHFAPVEDICSDDEFPAIFKLSFSKSLLSTMRNTCDFKDIFERTVYRYNEDKMLSWLRRKFECLKVSLGAHGTLHHAILDDEMAVQRQTFTVLSDFLPVELATLLKDYLSIPDVVYEKENQIGLKRSATDSHIENYASDGQCVPAKKPVKLSAAQKQLESASRGTKPILSFFQKLA